MAYIALTLFVVLHHEPWRDEADTWLYARDADLGTLFSRLRYIGSPGLWYVLLMPLAKSGLPYLSQSLFHLGLAAAAAALWLYRAPLPLRTRLLFLFSFFMAYEYAVVARSYVLSVLLLFVAAALHPRRFRQPLLYSLPVVLLAHANAHSIGIAAILGTAFGWQLIRSPSSRRNVRAWAAAAVMVASLAAAAFLLRAPPDPNIVSEGLPNPLALFASIGGAFFPSLDLWTAAFLGSVVLVAVAGLVVHRPHAFFVLAASCAWLLYVFVFRYSGSARHHGLILVVALYALWVAGLEDALPRLTTSAPSVTASLPPRVGLFAVDACLVFSVVYAALHWRLDTQEAFSASREMALYVRDAGYGGHTIAAHKAPHAEALLPYLPGVRFWYLGLGEFGTYMKWDTDYRVRGQDLPYEEALTRFNDVPAPRETTLLLLNAPVPEAFLGQFRLLYATKATVFFHHDEVYFLYAPVL